MLPDGWSCCGVQPSIGEEGIFMIRPTDKALAKTFDVFCCLAIARGWPIQNDLFKKNDHYIVVQAPSCRVFVESLLQLLHHDNSDVSLQELSESERKISADTSVCEVYGAPAWLFANTARPMGQVSIWTYTAELPKLPLAVSRQLNKQKAWFSMIVLDKIL